MSGIQRRKLLENYSSHDFEDDVKYILAKTVRYNGGDYAYWRGGADTRAAQKVRLREVLKRMRHDSI